METWDLWDTHWWRDQIWVIVFEGVNWHADQSNKTENKVQLHRWESSLITETWRHKMRRTEGWKIEDEKDEVWRKHSKYASNGADSMMWRDGPLCENLLFISMKRSQLGEEIPVPVCLHKKACIMQKLSVGPFARHNWLKILGTTVYAPAH